MDGCRQTRHTEQYSSTATIRYNNTQWAPLGTTTHSGHLSAGCSFHQCVVELKLKAGSKSNRSQHTQRIWWPGHVRNIQCIQEKR